MATAKSFLNSVMGAGKGVGNVVREGVDSMRGVFGASGGAGKTLLGGIGGFALDILSAPFRAIGFIGNNYPKIGLLAAAAATIVGYGWWKEKRQENALESQIKTEQKIAAELSQTGQMMNEAYTMYQQHGALQQPHAQDTQWQSYVNTRSGGMADRSPVDKVLNKNIQDIAYEEVLPGGRGGR